MRYIGSKTSVAEAVLDQIGNATRRRTLCDPFGGIGVIGAAAKARGFRVFGGDILRCAVAFQTARLTFSQKPTFQHLRGIGLRNPLEVEQHLANLQPREGWLTQHYSHDRNFFSKSNAEKIEACRQEIESWNQQGLLTYPELLALRAGLIASADTVANTAGTYYAYLKSTHRKANKPFQYTLLEPTSGPQGSVRLCDATQRATDRAYDVLYLDPPYNTRSYARYYHLPESLARGETPNVSGMAGIPIRQMPVSNFNKRSNALDALRAILNGADFKTVVFHYTDDGLIPLEAARQAIATRGRLREVELEAPGYTVITGRQRRAKHHLLIADA